ncbi:LysM peptidoglycan-binding domain-containing protein [Microbacterium sp. TNHR37B]|uniref:LysM peptidoglycan-binding domain-containing protein n=1 Tax=Microbacterium sp. TNHR37B TaxID=1775956 RepID=UPI0007B26D22|nr:LysM peptidoglycan-binding domain-containing protein [Microbacterium sp. TNHR37B]KZE90669.1 Muramidase-2 [Microbacterium sp. TNHR37B]
MRRLPTLSTSTGSVAVWGTIALSVSGSPGTAATIPEVPMETATPTIAALGNAVTAAASATVATPTTRTPRTHTVVRGDTVSAIAAAHGLRTADVLAWNGLGWRSIIRPGDVLRLSAAEKSTGSAGAEKPSKSSTRASHTSSTSYTVRSGDTLWAIADRHDCSLAALLRANDLTTGAIIYPGEKLAIPGRPSTAKATARPAAAPSTSSPQKATHGARLDAEQTKNARLIIAVGRERGVSDRGIAIALATAMVESWLRNLDYGTYDSLGLFQQRPSTGWGTPDQVRDPRRAAAAFFGGPDDPNGSDTRGLLDIAGWEDMEFSEAAQAVQRSAYPHRYGQWESQAYQWLERLG